MSADYFAHAAYGVPIEDKALQKLVALLVEAQEFFDGVLDEEDDPDEDFCSNEERNVQWVNQNRKKELDAIRDMVGAPADTLLIHTGYEDSHAGNSYTPADTWLFGYGYLSFPRPVPDEFQKIAEWHSWVTA